MGIKREVSNNASVSNIANNNSAQNEQSWAEEKQAFIDKIVELRSETQQCMLALKQSEDKIEAMKSANQELSLKISQSDKLHVDEIAEKDKRITELTRQRDLSQAKMKQLENAISQVQQNAQGDESENEYEVGCILRDKLVEKRVYLVRWKGYDSSEDSWVLESDLKCPTILKKYKQSKKL